MLCRFCVSITEFDRQTDRQTGRQTDRQADRQTGMFIVGFSLQFLLTGCKGHEKESLNLMSTYLPKDSGAGGVYTEGGGLFALGTIQWFCLSI